MGGGSSSSSGSTKQTMTDKQSARRMAAVAERQQEMAEEQWGLAREIFVPYERMMVEANKSLIDPNKALMELRLSEGARDIEADRPLKDLMREQRMMEMSTSAPLVSKFYEEAGAGVDVGAREAGAEADVVGEYANVAESVRRNLARSGTALTGARHENLMKAIALDRAKTISGARTSARQQAETESFSRLAAAMQARSGVSPTLDNTPYAQGEINLGDYALKSPVAAAMGLYGQAIDANAAGMRPLTQSKSSGSSLNFSI